MRSGAAPENSTADRVAVPATTFLTPPLARVGLNETQARELGRDVLVATKRVADIAAMPRPKILGVTHGLIKVVVDAQSDQVLDATLFCVDAQEVINLIALAMRTGATATELRAGIWTHPSSTGWTRTAANGVTLVDYLDNMPGGQLEERVFMQPTEPVATGSLGAMSWTPARAGPRTSPV